MVHQIVAKGHQTDAFSALTFLPNLQDLAVSKAQLYV
jgi:hypothetical protein